MKIYMVIDIEIKDENLYGQYIDQVKEIVEKHGGKYLVRGGKITPVSKNWLPERIIIIEFESYSDIDKCFSSKEYKEIGPLREKSTISKAILVEGIHQG